MSEENGAALSAAEIKAKMLGAGPVFAAVFVDGVGPMRVYAMSSKELDEFNKTSRQRRKRDPEKVRTTERMVIACLRDTDGNKIYTPADEDALSNIPVDSLLRIANAALKVNGLVEEKDDDAGN